MQEKEYCLQWVSKEHRDHICQTEWSTEHYPNKCAAAQENRKKAGDARVGLSTTCSMSIGEHEERLIILLKQYNFLVPFSFGGFMFYA